MSNAANSIKQILRANYWWKEFLQHEGARRRSVADESQAQALYAQAQQEIQEAYAYEREKALKTWMRFGLSRKQAEKRWRQEEQDIRREERMRYAFQKD